MRMKDLSVALALFILHLFTSVVKSQRINCDPCISRLNYVVKVIVHGTVDDVFWQNVQAAIEQSGIDMGVQLEMALYDAYDPNQMAADIAAAATSEIPPDALLITIPSEEVHDAVRAAVEAGIPVFGFNSGYDKADELGLLGFVAQHEYRAGIAAGEEMFRLASSNISKPLFINHQKGNTALEDRFRGFNTALQEQEDGVVVEELVVDLSDTETRTRKINSVFVNCPYDVVMLGGTATAVDAVSALVENGCEEQVVVGTFDEGSFVITSIVQGYIAFATSQQKYLQGVLPVVMASLYATTGKKLALPRDPKVYLTGPAIINQENVPTDTLATCESEAFPVCPNNYAPDGSISKCGCLDRADIRIGGVLHGVTTDSFWDPVFASAEQAAKDMGITLELERFQPEDDSDVLHQKMASRITTLCESGVDGIFITIPSESVTNAIKICQLLNVPVVSVNSGAEVAEEMGLLQHIGQLEYDAGYGAGQRLIEAGMKTGYCFNHAPHVQTTIERCRGLEDAIADSEEDVIYGGMHAVPEDNTAQYMINAEEAVGSDGNWEGVAILLMGQSQINHGALEIKKEHSSVMIGSFDIASYMYPLIEDGSILFGIDQQPYLQGNLPVYLLTYVAYTQQRLLNNVVQTGPDLIDSPQSPEQHLCESNFYQVCSIIPEEDLNYINSSVVAIGHTAVAITVAAGCLAFGWVMYSRNTNTVRAGQPEFMAMIIFGCVYSTLSIIPMGIETSYRYLKDPSTGELTSDENPYIGAVDAACMAVPWLYGLGFVVTFSALFAKILRVKLIYKAGQSMRRKRVGIRDVLPILGGMFAIELVLLLSWQFSSPFQWEREVTLQSPDGYALESAGNCTSELGWHFLLGIFLFHTLCLCYALVLCFQTKHIPTEFAESNWISLAVLCIFQVSVLALPIAAMVRHQSTVFYFVCACAIFLQNFTVLCLIFIPKVKSVRKGDQLPVSAVASRRASESAVSSSKRRFSNGKFTAAQSSETEGSCRNIADRFMTPTERAAYEDFKLKSAASNGKTTPSTSKTESAPNEAKQPLAADADLDLESTKTTQVFCARCREIIHTSGDEEAEAF